MSKLLLLVQSEADVQHLDAAAKAILNSSIKGVWVVFSPAITVNTSEAAKKLDGEIEQLNVAEQQAAARTDYEAAQGYKAQREGKELDRQKVLRDAWKTAPPEDRKKKAQEAFAPLIAQLQPNGINVKLTAHSDHYDREQWVQMLNSLSAGWFKEFVPGQFVVAWPESVETSIKVNTPGNHTLDRTDMEKAREQRAAAADKTALLQQEIDERVINTRRKQLQNMHGLKRRNIAKGLGIDVEGKEPEEVIALILAAEAKPKVEPEPALSEY